jgi:4-hydroxy-tetrahydrodipicolinate synthase
LLNLTLQGQQVFLASPSVHLYQWEGHMPMRTYTELAIQGKIDEAKRVFDSIAPVRDLANRWIWQPWSHGNLPFARLKYWQELMGMAGSRVRTPLREMVEEEKAAFRGDFEKAEITVPG